MEVAFFLFAVACGDDVFYVDNGRTLDTQDLPLPAASGGLR